MIVVESLNQSLDQLLRSVMRNVFDDVRNIDHPVVLQYAETKIVEEQEFHQLTSSSPDAQLCRGQLDAREVLPARPTEAFTTVPFREATRRTTAMIRAAIGATPYTR
jgi:hypothetical protein